MTQLTKGQPADLAKASEEVTQSPKNKWKKRLLMLGVASAGVAVGADMFGMAKTCAGLLVLDFATIIAEVGVLELCRKYSKKPEDEKKKIYDDGHSSISKKMVFLAASSLFVVVVGAKLDINGTAAERVRTEEVIAQAKEGITNPRACRQVMSWEFEDFLPHRRDVCVRASVERDGNFMLVTPCREKKDGSCEPSSDKPVIYRADKLISNGGLAL